MCERVKERKTQTVSMFMNERERDLEDLEIDLEQPGSMLLM